MENKDSTNLPNSGDFPSHSPSVSHDPIGVTVGVDQSVPAMPTSSADSKNPGSLGRVSSDVSTGPVLATVVATVPAGFAGNSSMISSNIPSPPSSASLPAEMSMPAPTADHKEKSALATAATLASLSISESDIDGPPPPPSEKAFKSENAIDAKFNGVRPNSIPSPPKMVASSIRPSMSLVLSLSDLRPSVGDNLVKLMSVVSSFDSEMKPALEQQVENLVSCLQLVEVESKAALEEDRKSSQASLKRARQNSTRAMIGAQADKDTINKLTAALAVAKKGQTNERRKHTQLKIEVCDLGTCHLPPGPFSVSVRVCLCSLSQKT